MRSAVSARRRRSRLSRRVSSSGRATLSRAVQHRHEVEELEDQADVPGAPVRQLVLAEIVEALAGDQHLAGARTVDAGDQVEQRRLARPRRSHEGDEVPRRNGQRYVLERVHLVDAAHVAPRDVVDLDEGGVPVAVHRRRSHTLTTDAGGLGGGIDGMWTAVVGAALGRPAVPLSTTSGARRARARQGAPLRRREWYGAPACCRIRVHPK